MIIDSFLGHVGMLATLMMPEKGVEGSSVKPSGLFVFGDSFADTGNRDPNDSSMNGEWRFRLVGSRMVVSLPITWVSIAFVLCKCIPIIS